MLSEMLITSEIISIHCAHYLQKDHTTGDQKGYYMGLSRDTVQQPGDRGMLMSRELPGKDIND